MGVQDQGRTRQIASLDEVDDLLAERRIPSVSVALILNGAVAWSRAWGWAVADEVPATPDTLFQAASISKPVAAIGALRLCADGRLALDDPIDVRLTSWRVPDVAGWRPRITLRHLLSHTCGLAVWGFPGYRRDATVPTTIQVLDGSPPANTPAVVPEAVPGLMWRYSGGGFTVLQQLVEDVAGEPFETALHDLVLSPLGMTSSAYAQPLVVAHHDRAAHGHHDRAAIEGGWHVYPEMAAAGLWTTPTDLARFAIAVEAAVGGRSGAILPAEIGAQIVSPCPVEPQAGLSLVLGREPVVRAHSGSNAGFQNMLVWSPGARVGVAAMTNGTGGGAVAAEVARYLGEAHGEPNLVQTYAFMHEAVAGMGRVRSVAPDAAARPAPPAATRYGAPGGGALDVDVAGSRLAVTAPGQDPLELVPSSDDGWTHPGLPVHLRFVDNGEVAVLEQLGREVRLPAR